MCLWLGHISRSNADHRPHWQFAVWLWVAAILYATLATRQHVLLDLMVGAALALVVYRVTGTKDGRRRAKACTANFRPSSSVFRPSIVEMHTRHHLYLGDPRDPDDYHNYTSNPRIVWTMHYLRLLTGAFLYIMLIPLLSLRHGSATERRQIVEEYAVLALVYLLVALWVPGSILFAAWFLPVILVGFLVNIRGFTQHGITEAHDAFLASRSMRVHPLLAFCLLNENYHLEHHLFPEVPSYRLGQLHDLIWSHLPRAVVGQSYLAFLARFVCATLKLDETPIGLTTPEQREING